jgi:hypothetical protein
MPLPSVRSYALTMLIIQVGLAFVGLTGIYPVSISVAGISTTAFLSSMEADLSNLVYNITHPGVVEYISAFYLVCMLAVKVVLSFLVFIFAGFGLVFAAIGFPAYIYAPLQIIVDAVVLYDFAERKI